MTTTIMIHVDERTGRAESEPFYMLGKGYPSMGWRLDPSPRGKQGVDSLSTEEENTLKDIIQKVKGVVDA